MPDYSNYRYNNCFKIKPGDIVTVEGDFDGNKNINPDSYGTLLPNDPVTGNIGCFIDWEIEPKFASNFRRYSLDSEEYEAGPTEKHTFTVFNLVYAWGGVDWATVKEGFKRYA